MILVEETEMRLDWPDTFRATACKNPDAVKFVEETEANVDCPVMFAVAVCIFPVPVAFVNVIVAIVPLGLLSSVEEETPKTWTRLYEEEAVKVAPLPSQSESLTDATSTERMPAVFVRP